MTATGICNNIQPLPMKPCLKSFSEWLSENLKVLSYPNPDEFSIDAFTNDNKTSDEKLVLLSLWLEDNFIRRWNLQMRDAFLRNSNSFWDEHGIWHYLSDLDFPRNWKNKKMKEIRIYIVYWLVCQAISESFNDKKAKGSIKTVNDKQGYCSEHDRDNEVFPLGFTTGDEFVDKIMTTLRMRYILESRQMQDDMNNSIADMQKFTVKKS